jgi:hypothetical protein
LRASALSFHRINETMQCKRRIYVGRELKRVPLDFNWPMKKVWGGYVNHWYNVTAPCDCCDGKTMSPFARELHDKWWGYTPFSPEENGSVPFDLEEPTIMAFAQRNLKSDPGFYGEGEVALIREAKRLARHFNKGWMHHLSQADVDALAASERGLPPGVEPTASAVNKYSLSAFGWGSTQSYTLIQARCDAAGQPYDCQKCGGEGCIWPSEQAKQAAEDWEREEPPTGDGYQMWETVSEGSPISPVLATPEELASWLEANPSGIDEGTTAAQWLAFINGPGWAPSMMSGPGGMMSGVQAVTS